MTTAVITTPLHEHLVSLGACKEALQWMGDKTPQETWTTCERPDWLLWWAARTPRNTHQNIVKCACDCARLVLHLVPVGEERPRLAIEAAERWADSPTKENKDAADAYAAYAAAYAAAYDAYAAYDAADAYAAYAAYAAADAADAAAYAAYAAAYAAYAAYDAADAYAAADAAAAANDAANDAARIEMRLKCSEAIRTRLVIPWEGE